MFNAIITVTAAVVATGAIADRGIVGMADGDIVQRGVVEQDEPDKPPQNLRGFFVFSMCGACRFQGGSPPTTDKIRANSLIGKAPALHVGELGFDFPLVH